MTIQTIPDNSAWAIEREDNSLDQSSDSEGEARRNEARTSTRGRSRGRRRGGEIVMRKFLFYFQILVTESETNDFIESFPQKKTRGCFSETN